MVAAVVGVGGFAAYRWQASEHASLSAQEHDTRLLKDRVWVDHVPRHDKDRIHLFLALTPKRTGRTGPIGIFEQVSQWEGHFEAFRYEAEGETMRIIFPQTGDRETLTVKPSACKQHNMDYCLDVSGNSRGVKRYYSRKGWEVKSVDEAEALVRAAEMPEAAPTSARK